MNTQFVRLFRDCLGSYGSWSRSEDEVREDEKGKYQLKHIVQEVPCDCHPETCCHDEGKVTVYCTVKEYLNENIEPSIDRTYRPTQEQWRRIVNETEFMANEYFPYSRIELIDFNRSMVHIKGGNKVGFDCLSEKQYVHVCNGGYYEDVS